MGIQAGVNGVSREVAELHCGVSGAVRSIAEGWGGVSGVARQFWAPASKTYAWNQYNLVETTQYQWTRGSGQSIAVAGSYELASQRTEHAETGTVSFSGISTRFLFGTSSGTYYLTSYTMNGAVLQSTECADTAEEYYELATSASGSYLYPYNRTAQITQSKGTLIGQVTSQDPDAYPQNGAQDGYWYEYVGEVEPEPEPDAVLTVGSYATQTAWIYVTTADGVQHEQSQNTAYDVHTGDVIQVYVETFFPATYDAYGCTVRGLGSGRYALTITGTSAQFYVYER